MKTTKICKRCNIEKPLNDFYKNKSNKDKRDGKCKVCISEYQKEVYVNNKEAKKAYSAEYYNKNIDKVKKRYEENKEEIAVKHKQWFKDNAEHVKEYNKQYKIKNKDEVNRRHREWIAKNKDKKSIWDKKWRENNKELKIQKDKEYRKNNKDKIAIYRKTEKYTISNSNSKNKRRFIQKSKSNGTLARDVVYPLTIELQELLNKQNNKCFYCDCELIEKHLDHYIPLSKGGSHSLDNVVWSCPSCNLSKGSKMPKEFITRQ